MSEKLEELISLLYQDKLTQYGKRLLVENIEKLQKENEELKEYNMTYKRILGLADNRIYRKKYLEERRKEQPNLLYPDSDEIYQRYYELKQENEKLKTKLSNILEAQKVIKVETLSYIKENYITIQKVKDKIEELNKLLADIDYKDITDKQEREFYKKEYYQVIAQIIVLKGLLGESEK